MLSTGKCYEHDKTGEKIRILGEVTSSLYGKCFVAESNLSYDFRAISSTQHWKEITEAEFELKK